ncbi:dynein axonemal intermediate chain 7 [Ambystoma mexicanum]|uniref:dynein axonemal intermediate chain 7 n=1 Tax=Ambystoma mexicanum TaxID=8296 RepID=UPI0037E7F59D
MAQDKAKSSKATSAGSKKKGKLSKAERLKLQKEEEERRIREEEEARLLAEKLEAERLERQRLALEERERLEAKELEHREDELADLRLLSEAKFTAAEKWKKQIRTNAKWDHYMTCDGSPDPTTPKDINTFITLWKEEDIDFDTIHLKIDQAIALSEKLEYLLLETPPQELSENDIAHYNETIQELQSISQKKFNSAAENLLQRASVLADLETGNMQQIINDPNGILRVWANLNKNPRFRGYDFSDGAIGFDLPKPMAMSNIAITILHTYFDHLSKLCSTFGLRIKKVTEESKPEPSPVLESIGEDVNPSEGEEDEGEAEVIPSLDEEPKADERKSSMSVTSVQEEAKSLPEDSEKLKDELVMKTEGRIEDISGGTEVNVTTPEMGVTESQEEVIKDDVIDLRQFTPLGGVYYVRAVELPPQAKQVKGWTMVQVLDREMQRYPYPPDVPNTVSDGGPKPEKESDLSAYPPVGINFKLLENVIFFEEPQIARWDKKGKHWTTNGIIEHIYKKEQREMSLKMEAFHIFTLFQDAHLNMPYESWELTPKGVNKVTFVIYAAFTEVKIEIMDNQCCLSSLSNAEGADLSNLIGKWMSPFALKIALKRAGINIFPEEDSDRYVSINKKDELAEKAAYEQMAILSPAFAFSWSQWNLKSNYQHIIVKVAELINSEDVKDEDWSLYMLSTERACRLKISESSEDFSEDTYENSELHSTLFHMIKCYANDAAMEQVKNSHYLFVDCVHQLLKYTKVLTYS